MSCGKILFFFKYFIFLLWEVFKNYVEKNNL